MPTSDLYNRTWEEIRDLAPGLSLAILPVGAIEAHGPHLPLATDVIIAEAMARAGAAKLDAAGYEALILPSLAYTSAGFAAGFSGTISLDSGIVSSTIIGIARSLASHGMKVLAVANAHLDPEHIASIEAAAEVVDSEGSLELIFPDITRVPWALRLTDEFKSGACHAGQYETSIVMAERPDLVREDVRAKLSPNPSSLSEAIRSGLRSFEEAGGPAAYFGFPAQASAEEGERTIETLGAILADAVLERISV